MTEGNIPGHPNLSPPASQRAGGVFGSYARPTTGSASTRDSSTSQDLRASYTYLQAPVLGPLPQPTNIPIAVCAIFGCALDLQPWMAKINPPWDAWNKLFGKPARLLAASGRAGYTFAIVPDQSTGAGRDAAALLTPDLRALLGARATHFLPPVDRASAMRRFGEATHYLAVPHRLSSAAEVQRVRFDGGHLGLMPVPVTPQTLAPSERTRFRAVWSLEQQTLYVVGGQETWDGSAANEVWAYDLARATWENLVFTAPAPRRPLAVALDPAAGHLLVVDEAELDDGSVEVRFLLLDLLRHRTTVLATVPRTGTFDRFSLTARQDRSYVLVANDRNTGSVTGYRFIVDAGGALLWTGQLQMGGALIDTALLTPVGVRVALLDSGRHRLLELTDGHFQSSSNGPKSL